MPPAVLAILAVVAVVILARRAGGGRGMILTESDAVTFILPFLKSEEGFSATPYPDNSQNSIGYGSRYIPGITPNPITRPQAEARLIELLETEYMPGAVADLARKGITWGELEVHQQGAILSFVYNLGPNICASATWPQKWKAGNVNAARASWLAHNKERKAPGAPLTVNPVLAARRIREWNIFTKGTP